MVVIRVTKFYKCIVQIKVKFIFQFSTIIEILMSSETQIFTLISYYEILQIGTRVETQFCYYTVVPFTRFFSIFLLGNIASKLIPKKTRSIPIRTKIKKKKKKRKGPKGFPNVAFVRKSDRPSKRGSCAWITRITVRRGFQGSRRRSVNEGTTKRRGKKKGKMPQLHRHHPPQGAACWRADLTEPS